MYDTRPPATWLVPFVDAGAYLIDIDEALAWHISTVIGYVLQGFDLEEGIGAVIKEVYELDEEIDDLRDDLWNFFNHCPDMAHYRNLLSPVQLQAATQGQLVITSVCAADPATMAVNLEY